MVQNTPGSAEAIQRDYKQAHRSGSGLIPDVVPWADPFANMRLYEDVPTREPWHIDELRLLFSSPVFVGGGRPRRSGVLAPATRSLHRGSFE